MQQEINALSMTEFHDRKLADSNWPEHVMPHLEDVTWSWIEANHRYNILLWNEEDKARRTDVEPAEIAACKRLIDQYNQKRRCGGKDG